jgi:hypothetical protein
MALPVKVKKIEKINQNLFSVYLLQKHVHTYVRNNLCVRLTSF